MLPYGRKNPLPFPLFRSGRTLADLRQTIQGKGVIHKRVETAGVYPLVRPRGVSAGCLPSCAPARQARFRSLHKRHSAVLHQNAKEEHF